MKRTPPFMFATGIENSAPTIEQGRTRVDEMEKCGFYKHWRTDFQLVEDLGITFLRYGPQGEKVITGLQRISRPGRRVYFGVEDVPTVLGGLGTSILTTSRGVMTGRAAKKAGVGGEVLCTVW